MARKMHHVVSQQTFLIYHMMSMQKNANRNAFIRKWTAIVRQFDLKTKK